jgi:hypothetical protein
MTQPTEQPTAGHVLRVTAIEDQVELYIECHEPPTTFCRTMPGGETGVSCHAVNWFDMCTTLEVRDPDAGPEALADGMPVTVSWNGDVESWVWRTGVPASERVA